MDNVLWEISKRIIFEQRYQSLKGNPSFINRFSANGRRAGRSLRSFIIANYIASVFSFSLLSVALTFVRLISNTSADLTDLEVLLYFYVFSANIFNTIVFLDGIVSENILQPVVAVPLENPHVVLPAAYMIYYGSSSTFVITPFLILEFIAGHSLEMLLTGILWMFVYIGLGYIAGAAVFYFLYAFRNPGKPSLLKNAGTLFRIFVIVMVFSFFEIWIYDPQAIPQIFLLQGYGFVQSLIPVLNTAVLVTQHLTSRAAVYEIIAFSVFSGSCILLNFYLQRPLFRRIMLPGGMRGARTGASAFKPGRLRTAMFLKDLRIIFRKSQYSLMLFFPVMVSIPFAVPLILSNSGSSHYNPLGLYYALLSIPVICSSIYALISYMAEGNAIPTLFMLPDLVRRNILSKAAVGIAIFSSIIIPMTLIVMGIGLYGFLDYLLLPLNLISGFSFTYVNLLNRLRKKLNPYITVVNIDTFGGSFGLMISFGYVLFLILIPVVAGELISVYAFPEYGRTFTLFVDLLLNVSLLLISIKLIFRKSGRAQKRRLPASPLRDVQ